MPSLERRRKNGDNESRDVTAEMRNEVAETLGVEVEELNEMSIREIEERLDIEVDEPSYPVGGAGGYPISHQEQAGFKGYDTLSAGTYHNIKRKVRKILG